MGMTIDEVIKALKWFLEYNEEDYCGGDRFQDEYGDLFYKVSERDFKAFRQAVETMRKYQQIEQIVNAEFEEYHPLDRNIYRLALIREVLKDGANSN